MKYAVSPEGVEELKKMSAASREAIQVLVSSISTVLSAVDEYSDTLGPHHKEILETLRDIGNSLKENENSVDEIAQTLDSVADKYQGVIDKSLGYSGNASGGGGVSGGSSSGGGSGGSAGGSGLSGNWPATSAPGKFGPFETGQYSNGTNVVKGDNYDQYMTDYYNADNSSFDRFDEPQIQEISPSNIEGIELGPKERENPGSFWSQHDSNGTAESFKDIAKKIPSVKSQLAQGKSLSEIRSDPGLADCVSIYFDPSNMVEVEKWGDYHVFTANGRHRILAARDAGLNIPVKVTGVRSFGSSHVRVRTR